MYLIYESDTGRIVQVTTMHSVIPTDVGDGLAVLEIAPDAGSLQRSFYVADGRLAPRSPMGVPDEIDLVVGEVVSIAVPDGAIATVDGAATVIDDGALEIASDMPATYRIGLEAVGHLAASILVTVTEA